MKLVFAHLSQRELFARDAIAIPIEAARIAAVAHTQRRSASGAGSAAIGVNCILVAAASGIDPTSYAPDRRGLKIRSYARLQALSLAPPATEPNWTA
jgi:hypothetical protein